MASPEPIRGRPRDPRTHADIMSATRFLLARDGYDQVSIDAIAREAGVSRPTVYRRWPSKAHVVFDATFGELGTDGEKLFSSGDFATDLHRFVRATVEFWREPVVEAAALGILAERHRNPDLHIRTQQLLDEQTRLAFAALAERGIADGILRTDLEIDTLFRVIIGTTFYTVQVGNAGDDIDTLVAQLCSLVLRGARRED